MHFSELTEDVKASKARVLVTLEESDDPCVKNVFGGKTRTLARQVPSAHLRYSTQ